MKTIACLLLAGALAGCATSGPPMSAEERQARIRNGLLMLQMAGPRAPGASMQGTQTPQATGLLKREFVSQNNRICVYDRPTGEYAITISAFQLCPVRF